MCLKIYFDLIYFEDIRQILLSSGRRMFESILYYIYVIYLRLKRMNTTLTFDEFVFPRRQRSLILLTMLLVFTLCWLPLNLINLMEDLEVELEVSDHCADPVYPGAAPVLALLLPHLLHLPRVRHVEHLLEPHPLRPAHQVCGAFRAINGTVDRGDILQCPWGDLYQGLLLVESAYTWAFTMKTLC